jgi:hypothetical protein
MRKQTNKQKVLLAPGQKQVKVCLFELRWERVTFKKNKSLSSWSISSAFSRTNTGIFVNGRLFVRHLAKVGVFLVWHKPPQIWNGYWPSSSGLRGHRIGGHTLPFKNGMVCPPATDLWYRRGARRPRSISNLCRLVSN